MENKGNFVIACATCACISDSTIHLSLILSYQMSHTDTIEGCRHECSRGCQRVVLHLLSVTNFLLCRGRLLPISGRACWTLMEARCSYSLERGQNLCETDSCCQSYCTRHSKPAVFRKPESWFLLVGMPDAVCVPNPCKRSFSVWFKYVQPHIHIYVIGFCFFCSQNKHKRTGLHYMCMH